jgi:multiple antibiotic resistance protein
MVNVIGNLPLFADMTSELNRKERFSTFTIATITGGSIVLAFALFGDIMLRYVFEVSTAAFRIAGGILVFLVAARGVLLGSPHKGNDETKVGSVAVFPMGFPYLAGTGTILTTILLIQSDGRVMTAITVIAVYAVVLPILRISPFVERTIGKVGVMVVSRILYIFICAKAVSFILDAFKLSL